MYPKIVPTPLLEFGEFLLCYFLTKTDRVQEGRDSRHRFKGDNQSGRLISLVDLPGVFKGFNYVKKGRFSV